MPESTSSVRWPICRAFNLPATLASTSSQKIPTQWQNCLINCRFSARQRWRCLKLPYSTRTSSRQASMRNSFRESTSYSNPCSHRLKKSTWNCENRDRARAKGADVHCHRFCNLRCSQINVDTAKLLLKCGVRVKVGIAIVVSGVPLGKVSQTRKTLFRVCRVRQQFPKFYTRICFNDILSRNFESLPRVAAACLPAGFWFWDVAVGFASGDGGIDRITKSKPNISSFEFFRLIADLTENWDQAFSRCSTQGCCH